MLGSKYVLLGGAGLVGQNLVALLKEAGYSNIVVIDKHAANLATLKELHSEILAIKADLAVSGTWQDHLASASAIVMLQAQIGGMREDDFVRNNLLATENVLAACKKHGVRHLVHVSSSVVNSLAQDFYAATKRKQEQLVLESGIPFVVLRPTLMFGWFDRKHLGWLSRFMHRTPVFPIPGSGRYVRQPLYARDFCKVILACLLSGPNNQVFDISGMEKIDYIDLIRSIKKSIDSKALILRIPYSLFWLLLKIYSLMDRNPPFTTRQLEALVLPEEFPLTHWAEIFGIAPTPLRTAIQEAFGPSRYQQVVLEF